MMTNALNQFFDNIENVKSLGAVYSFLYFETPTTTLELSEILRAELVLAVSALDQYIHEIVKMGIVGSYNGLRPKGTKYRKFHVSIDNPFMDDSSYWLESEIVNKHRYKSFQKSEKVAEAIQLISDADLWVKIASAIGDTPDNIKIRLDLIIDRRNKIVHEADCDPSSPPKRWSIQEEDVNEAIVFLEIVAKVIDNLY